MKDKLVLLAKTILFLILLAAALFVVSLVVQRKSSYEKNQMFFEEAKKDNIDVFILGSSHVINGINPIQLYDDYGITAYNLGGYGSVLLSSYWQMMMALDYATPKLVVVDAYMLENDIRYIDDPQANVSSDELHLNIDRFPLNRRKYQAVNNMLENWDKKYQYLFDFIVYHDRWKELTQNDYDRLVGKGEINHLMGAVMNYDIHPSEFTYTDYQAGNIPGETVGTEYLRNIITECQNRGIDVLVTTVPFLAMQVNQEAANTADTIAAERGVKSLNMLKIPNLIDFNMDMADAGHLNILGCQKVTKCLGDYISENYELQDHRNDSSYETWNQCSSEFKTVLGNLSMENEDLYSQTMVLQYADMSDDKTFAVSIRGGSMVYADQTFIRMLKGLGAGEELDKAIEQKSSYMLVCSYGHVQEFSGNSETESHVSTQDGELTYIPVSDIYRVLYLNGDTENNMLYADDMAYADVQMLFFDEGEVASHQYYTCDHFDYEYQQR